MNPPRTGILILTGEDNLALSILRGLGANGLRATVAGVGSGWLKLSRYCTAYASVARSAEELAEPSATLIDSLVRLVRQRGITFIVPADVPAEYCAARLKPLLPDVHFFPSAEPETLKLMDNKWLFYQFLAAQGLPTPRTWEINSADEARRLPLPLVLKPLSYSGGRGISVIRDEAQREACLSGDNAYLRLPIIAQEFIEGEDVDISFLADHGRLIAWAVQTRDREDVIHYIEDERVVAQARRIAQASAYTGVAHVDMRYEGKSRTAVKVIECNPRFWGSLQYTLGFDVDFMGRGLALAAGEPVEPLSEGPIGACSGFKSALRRILSGRFDISTGTRGYLAQKFRDPLPELHKGMRNLFGVAG